jgi:preprotein translocase subunit Sec63
MCVHVHRVCVCPGKRQASDGEIKSAFRTQAMKWHPDKNIDNRDEATERFKEVSASLSLCVCVCVCV